MWPVLFVAGGVALVAWLVSQAQGGAAAPLPAPPPPAGTSGPSAATLAALAKSVADWIAANPNVWNPLPGAPAFGYCNPDAGGKVILTTFQTAAGVPVTGQWDSATYLAVGAYLPAGQTVPSPCGS